MSSVDADLAKRLAEYYAPECRFDSREKFFPCGIDWLATHSSLWCKTWWDQKITTEREVQQKDKQTWIIDVQLASAGESTDPKAASSSQCNLDQEESGVSAQRHQHRLRPVPDKWEGQSAQEMEQGEVPCYYAVVPAPCNIFDDDGFENVCEDVYEITYYMVYAYNGNIFMPCGLCSPMQVGVHEGDVEQVLVYVKDPDTLREGEDGLLTEFQHRHAGEGRFCEAPEIVDKETQPGAHCVVYPASESHASYSKPSWTCRIFGFASDRHNGKGRQWQTWKNLQAIDKAQEQPPWIAFDGCFGGVDGLAQRSNVGRPGFSSRACRLPAMLPDGIARAKPESAKKQIPRKLAEAVSKKNGN